MKINFIDLKRQYELCRNEINGQVQSVFDTASFILGSKVAELENKAAFYAGTSYAVGCASGTDALLLALKVLDVKPGDEVITTPFTFIATAEVIALLGARPVFVDIEPETYNIDATKIKDAITSKTRGIITVDLFGQCADYDEILSSAKSRGLFVIEDAAQSFGASYKGRRAGSLADIGCTSFFPAKPLGCYGDGGMIFVNDDKMVETFISLREHGKGKDKYDNIRIGFNSRLDTLQAAILLAKFPVFLKEIELRQEVADRYAHGLKDVVVTPKILGHNLSVFAQYCIRVNGRERLQEELKSKGIPTAVYYPKPLHLQTAFQCLGYHRGDFPVSELVAEDIVALPMHPYLTAQEQEYIIENIRNFKS